MKKRILKRKDIYNLISVSITVGFVVLSVFVFPHGIIRLWESLKDLWYSFLYYVTQLFELDYIIRPTVIDYSSVPMVPLFGLPTTWEAFKELWLNFWSLFFTSENISAYGSELSEMIRISSRMILAFVVPLILIFYVAFDKYMNSRNNRYNVDSKWLKRFKGFYKKIISPIKSAFAGYFKFIKRDKKYRNAWILIWIYNFNLIVIVIEIFAYYLYFVPSFDFLSLYVQIYKLFSDLSAGINFFPLAIWIFICLFIFDKIRRNMGYKKLLHHECKNCGFINALPIVSMACGTMGSKKTTMISDMALLQEKMFRDKALVLMLENDMKFPEFPWARFEHGLRYAIKRHYVYNLATVKKYVHDLKCYFELGNEFPEYKSCIRRYLNRKYRLFYKHNLIFDYDFEKYGLTYNDQLKVIDIWSCVESYAQEYFIYIAESSLIISNYALRTDNVLYDLGNLPLYDDDFYRRDSTLQKKVSRYSHIIDFNAMRLGKKFGDLDDPKKDSFEFGVVNFTEGGKERKNNLQLQEMKKKDDIANQKNDGFNDWLKMVRHSGTVDYFPFVKVFTDEQRPESWGADGRDLCQIIHIRDGGETKLALPMFFIEELLYTFVYDKFISLYLKYRYVRADNTVLLFFFKKLASMLQSYYKGVYNTFGYSKMTLALEDGTMDGEKTENFYYLDNKRIYSDRFSTDCFSDFFTTKALRSQLGINDLEEYKTSKATFDELKKQNSYFVNDLINKQENENQG